MCDWEAVPQPREGMIIPERIEGSLVELFCNPDGILRFAQERYFHAGIKQTNISISWLAAATIGWAGIPA